MTYHQRTVFLHHDTQKTAVRYKGSIYLAPKGSKFKSQDLVGVEWRGAGAVAVRELSRIGEKSEHWAAATERDLRPRPWSGRLVCVCGHYFADHKASGDSYKYGEYYCQKCVCDAPVSSSSSAPGGKPEPVTTSTSPEPGFEEVDGIVYCDHCGDVHLWDYVGGAEHCPLLENCSNPAHAGLVDKQSLLDNGMWKRTYVKEY